MLSTLYWDIHCVCIEIRLFRNICLQYGSVVYDGDYIGCPGQINGHGEVITSLEPSLPSNAFRKATGPSVWCNLMPQLYYVSSSFSNYIAEAAIQEIPQLSDKNVVTTCQLPVQSLLYVNYYAQLHSKEMATRSNQVTRPFIFTKRMMCRRKVTKYTLRLIYCKSLLWFTDLKFRNWQRSFFCKHTKMSCLDPVTIIIDTMPIHRKVCVWKKMKSIGRYPNLCRNQGWISFWVHERLVREF